jgi:hypothetical protein
MKGLLSYPYRSACCKNKVDLDLYIFRDEHFRPKISINARCRGHKAGREDRVLRAMMTCLLSLIIRKPSTMIKGLCVSFSLCRKDKGWVEVNMYLCCRAHRNPCNFCWVNEPKPTNPLSAGAHAYSAQLTSPGSLDQRFHGCNTNTVHHFRVQTNNSGGDSKHDRWREYSVRSSVWISEPDRNSSNATMISVSNRGPRERLEN